MAYRDERDAMQARIEQLEAELAEVRAEGREGEPSPAQNGNPWFGAPLRLVYERELDGELPEEALEELVSILRRQTDQLGRVDRLGRTLAWSTGGQRNQPQATEFTCEVRDGRTRLRLTEGQGQLAGGLFGGIVGGVGGGGLGIWIPLLATGLLSPLLSVAVMVLWLALIWMLVRFGFAYAVGRRRAKLDTAFSQVVDRSAAAIRRARIETEPARARVAVDDEAAAEATASEEAEDARPYAETNRRSSR